MPLTVTSVYPLSDVVVASPIAPLPYQSISDFPLRCIMVPTFESGVVTEEGQGDGEGGDKGEGAGPKFPFIHSTTTTMAAMTTTKASNMDHPIHLILARFFAFRWSHVSLTGGRR